MELGDKSKSAIIALLTDLVFDHWKEISKVCKRDDCLTVAISLDFKVTDEDAIGIDAGINFVTDRVKVKIHREVSEKQDELPLK
jgi:hypothetical protein